MAISNKYNIVVKAVLDKVNLTKQITDIEKNLKPVKIPLQVGDKNNQSDALKTASKNVDALTKSHEKLAPRVKESGKAHDSLTTSIGKAIYKMVLWKVAGDMLFGTLRQAEEAVQYISDLNKEMTNIRMVTDMSAESAKNLSGEFNELAQAYGATTTEVAAGATEWFRQGKTQAETMDLIKSSIMLSKLANMESSVATEKLTAVMNGFNLTSEQSIGVLDRLVALDNNYATSVQEIITAMQKSSAVAQGAGVDFEHLAAMITVISSKTRQSAETIGDSMKTILTRMQTIKMGKFFEDETQSLSDVEAALAQPGIEIALRKSTREFRDMQDVIEDIGTRWNEFDDMQKSTIAGAMAGVRQADRFKTLMQNYPELANALKIELESGGIALSRYQIYLQSIEASTNRLKTAWEGLAMTILDSSIVNFFNNWAAAILDTITKIITLDVSITTLAQDVYGLFNALRGGGEWKPASNSLLGNIFKFLGNIKMGTAVDKTPISLTSGAGGGTGLEDSYLTSGGAASATKELSDNQKAYNDLLKMTIDMLKDKANAEKDALKDELDGYKSIIDARKKILDQQKEEKNYQDALAEKNKELSTIENELLEIQFDNSEWAKKRRLELEDEKAKKIKEIDKDQYDKSIDDQKDALDEEYDNYKKSIDARIKELDNYLSESGTLTQEAMDLLSDRSSGFYNELLEWNRRFGTGIDEDVIGKWNTAFNAIVTYSGGAVGAIGAVETAVKGLGNALDNLTWQEIPEGYGLPPDWMSKATQNDFDTRFQYRTSESGASDFDTRFEYRTHHAGGIVGGLPKIQEGETFAKLLNGEVVANNAQMKTFINNTLPNLVANVAGGGGVTISMPITIQGNADESTIPKFKNAVLDVINTAMKKRGYRNNVSAYSL